MSANANSPQPASPSDKIERRVSRIVRDFNPHQVVLFGSHARGDTNAASDIDLLVVFERLDDKEKMEKAMRDAVRPLDTPTDIRAATRRGIERRLVIAGHLYRNVCAEGMVLHGPTPLPRPPTLDRRVLMNNKTAKAAVDSLMKQAKEDLRDAKILVGAVGASSGAGQIVQQAAEKAIKAMLIHEAKPYERTHDIDKLIALLSRVPKGEATSVEIAWETVNSWSGPMRYAEGDSTTRTKRNVELAIRQTERVIARFERSIRRERMLARRGR